MNGDGREGPGQMSDQRQGDVGPILETWMAAVAPRRAPERLFEESFARTMVARQQSVYPWQSGIGRRHVINILTILNRPITRCLNRLIDCINRLTIRVHDIISIFFT